MNYKKILIVFLLKFSTCYLGSFKQNIKEQNIQLNIENVELLSQLYENNKKENRIEALYNKNKKEFLIRKNKYQDHKINEIIYNNHKLFIWINLFIITNIIIHIFFPYFIYYMLENFLKTIILIIKEKYNDPDQINRIITTLKMSLRDMPHENFGGEEEINNLKNKFTYSLLNLFINTSLDFSGEIFNAANGSFLFIFFKKIIHYLDTPQTIIHRLSFIVIFIINIVIIGLLVKSQNLVYNYRLKNVIHKIKNFNHRNNKQFKNFQTWKKNIRSEYYHNYRTNNLMIFLILLFFSCGCQFYDIFAHDKFNKINDYYIKIKSNNPSASLTNNQLLKILKQPGMINYNLCINFLIFGFFIFFNKINKDFNFIKLYLNSSMTYKEYLTKTIFFI